MPERPRQRHPIADMHPDDQADALLSLRQRGCGTCAQLADLTGLPVAHVEALLVGGVGLLIGRGFSELAICTEYRFTAAQVREAVRRTGARPPGPGSWPQLGERRTAAPDEPA